MLRVLCYGLILLLLSEASWALPRYKKHFGWFLNQRFGALTIRQEETGRLFQVNESTEVILNGMVTELADLEPWMPVECTTQIGKHYLRQIYAVTPGAELQKVRFRWLSSGPQEWYPGHPMRVRFQGPWSVNIEPYAFGLGVAGRVERDGGNWVAVWDTPPPGSIRGGVLFLRDNQTKAIVSQRQSYTASQGTPRITDVLLSTTAEDNVMMVLELSNEGFLPLADSMSLRVAGQDVSLISRGVKHVVAEVPSAWFEDSGPKRLPYKLFFKMERLGLQELRGWLPSI